MNYEWIQNLKAGDEIYVSQSYGAVPKKATVSRLTKAQVFVKGHLGGGSEYEEAFWKKDGWKVGGSDWSRQFLIEANDAVKEKVEIDILKRRVNDMRNKLGTPDDKDTLLKLIEALKPFVKVNP